MFKKILIRLYILACLKTPSFNAESALRVRLKCDIHSHENESEKLLEVCPCLYDMDDWTIEELIKESIWREDIVSFEIKKWLYFSEYLNEYELKEERTKEVIIYLKRMSYNIKFWIDLGKSWKTKIHIDNNKMA